MNKTTEKHLEQLKEKGITSQEIDDLMAERQKCLTHIEIEKKRKDKSKDEKKSKITSIEVSLKGIESKIQSVSKKLLLNNRTDEEKRLAKEKMAKMRAMRGANNKCTNDASKKDEQQHTKKPVTKSSTNEDWQKHWGL